MANSLSPLMFTVGLIDRISGPAQRATESFNNLVADARSGFSNMASGAIGLAGTGTLLYGALQPALALESALGDVKALGMQENALASLKDTSMDLASSYGIAVTEVVTGSARLKSSIGNLSDAEFIDMTNAAGTLAAGTKTSMDDATRYITQMYERYKASADSIGKTEWVNQLVSKTAFLKKSLGTDVTEITDAMEGLNNLGTGLGVGLDEQLAVVATLSKSTGISDAEQQYTAFLEQVFEAQDKLGMSFTDSTGALLPMVDILGKLQNEFGNLQGVEAWQMLDDAFGDGSKLIQQLSKDTSGLNKTMLDLGKINSIELAGEMAKEMAGPWSKMASAINNVQTIIGDLLLPSLMPLIDGLKSGADQIKEWSRIFPNLSRTIVTTGLAILGLTAGMAAVTIAVGIAKAALAGFKVLVTAVRSITLLWAGAQWLLNAAFIASPIGLIVIGITALVSVIYAAFKGIMALWDAIKDTGPVKGLIKMLNMIPGVDISSETSTEVPALQETKQNEVPAGGITNQISKSIADNSSSNNTVNITTNEAITPAQIEQMMMMGV